MQNLRSFSKGSQKSKQFLNITRSSGDHIHHKSFINAGDGDIIPAQMSAHHVLLSQLLPCHWIFCFGYVVKTMKAQAKCRNYKSSNPKIKQYHQAVSPLLLPLSSALSDVFKINVTGKMSTEKVSSTARNDNMIAKFGEPMFTKLGHKQH